MLSPRRWETEGYQPLLPYGAGRVSGSVDSCDRAKSTAASAAGAGSAGSTAFEPATAPAAGRADCAIPDALLAQVLTASTYPLEVTLAARWTEKNPNVKGPALEAAMQKEPWDPSVTIFRGRWWLDRLRAGSDRSMARGCKICGSDPQKARSQPICRCRRLPDMSSRSI